MKMDLEAEVEQLELKPKRLAQNVSEMIDVDELEARLLC